MDEERVRVGKGEFAWCFRSPPKSATDADHIDVYTQRSDPFIRTTISVLNAGPQELYVCCKIGCGPARLVEI